MELIKPYVSFKLKLQLQWNPLNVITWGQRESDNINRMITISDLQLIQST